MLSRLFLELGPWNWMVLGFALLALEIVVPGVYLLWVGVAALLVGALAVQFAAWDALSWQVEVLIFLALSLLTAWGGRRLFGGAHEESDQPLLNRRGEQLIGATAVLDEPIREGVGRIRLGDTLWRVQGPDLPAGARVRVTGVEDARLVVAEA